MITKRRILFYMTLSQLLIACSGPAHVAYAEPVSFSGLDYCSDAGSAEVKAHLESAETILTSDDAKYDGDELANAILVTAASKVALASASRSLCEDSMAEGEQIFTSFLESKRKAFDKLGKSRFSRNADIREIQEKIKNLWREDQVARGVYVGLRTDDMEGSAYWAERLAAAHTTRMDHISKTYLESILDEYDWIDRKRFGKVVSDHAWLLAQHADDDPEFQSLVLSRMTPYLNNKGIEGKHYAYLWDRVAVNTGRQQRYGTQPDWNCVDGKMKLKPLENPETVNERRRELGLNSVEDGLLEMNRQTCHAPK